MYIKDPKIKPREKIRRQDLLREAVAAIEAGNKNVARHLLRKAAQEQPNDQRVWLWRASVAVNLEEAIGYMERVLALNPSNEKAREWLARARKTMLSPPRPWRCPVCEAAAPRTQNRCPACGVVVDLADLDAIAKNDKADRAVLSRAIERSQKQLRQGPDAPARIRLALAYLHLKNSTEALAHLREACRLRPDDSALLRVLEQIRARRVVLVVDDDLAVQTLLAAILESRGLRVKTAANGLQALGAIDAELPDLILLDVSMPELGGFKVCRILRANVATRPIPVVMTGNGRLQQVRARAAGATDFVQKPLEPSALLRKLGRHLPELKGTRSARGTSPLAIT